MNMKPLLLGLACIALPLSAQNFAAYIDNEWPNHRYEVYDNGTVLDTKTNLLWKRCSEGQTYDTTTKTCHGSASAHTWKAALQLADSHTFANRTDWRVPNIKELASLAALDREGPAINLAVFPGTPSSWYWSASPDASDADDVWLLSFSHGNDNLYYRSYDYARYKNHQLRLVASGQ